MNKYKAAIIGCGSRAPAHIGAYSLLDNAEIVACCAPTGKHRDPLAQQYGLRPYSDASEMIRSENPDIVHIITWPDTRLELMSLVNEMGVPLCTVEKPVASGVQDWLALQKLKAQSVTKFAVCHQVRWQPLLMNCQQAVMGGELGEIKFLDISAGMNISGQGTHTLNYGRSLLSNAKVTQVFGNVCGWDAEDAGHPAPEVTEAFLTFENGVRGMWTSGSISPHCGDPQTTWQHVRVAAYAHQGRVNFEEFGKWEIISPNGVQSGDYGGMEQWRKNNMIAQSAFHTAMFEWLEDDAREPGTSLRESLHEWAVVLALYQSALEGRSIEMAKFDPPTDLVERIARR